MTVTVEIPDERIERFEKAAQSQGLTLDQWLLALAQEAAPQTREISIEEMLEVFKKVRGKMDDVDFSRDPTPSREVIL